MGRLDPIDRAEFLSQIPLFEALAAGQLGELGAVTRSRSLSRKEELFHKGDEGSEIFLVVTGKLKAITTSLEGDDVVFSIHGPGDFFGEIALLAGTSRTATVVAIEPCELLALARRDLLDFLRRHPDTAIQMLGFVSKRLAHVSELVEDTLFLNLPIRLAKKLLELDHEFGLDTKDGGRRLDIKLSQTEWGDLVGATRESINKQLQTWKKEGLLSTERGRIVIHRMDALERLADALLQ